jgi:hypothetical protein
MFKVGDRVEICAKFHHVEGDITEYDEDWKTSWIGPSFVGTIVAIEDKLRRPGMGDLLTVQFDNPIGRTIDGYGKDNPKTQKYMFPDWVMYPGELRILK